MTKKLLTTIEDLDVVEFGDGSFRFLGNIDVDMDGTDEHGQPYDKRGDKSYLPSTSLKFNGRSLDARKVKYVVVPTQLLRKVKGVVLGCKVIVWDMLWDVQMVGVVGDAGPDNKDGEISAAMAKALGLDDSPVTGGCDQKRFLFIIYPDVPAVVDGVTYHLQPLVGSR